MQLDLFFSFPIQNLITISPLCLQGAPTHMPESVVNPRTGFFTPDLSKAAKFPTARVGRYISSSVVFPPKALMSRMVAEHRSSVFIFVNFVAKIFAFFLQLQFFRVVLCASSSSSSFLR